jgi:hypothetical protein
MKKKLFITLIFHLQVQLNAQNLLNQITDSLNDRYASAIRYLNDSSRSVIDNIIAYNHFTIQKKKAKTKVRASNLVRFIIYDTICSKSILIKEQDNQEKINLPVIKRYPKNSLTKDSSIIEYSIQTQNDCTALRGLKRFPTMPIEGYQVEFSPILNNCLIVELFSGSAINNIKQCCRQIKFGEGHLLLIAFHENSSSIKKVYYGSTYL